MKRKFWGLIVLAVGVMMVLRAMGVSEFLWFFDGSWHKYIIPGLIVLVGFKLILSSSKQTNNGFKLCEVPDQNDGELPKMSVAFSGNAYNFNGEHFRGAKLDVMLGGITLDLNGAEIENGAVIDAHCFMGGVELRLPQDVNVEIHSDCFLGGVDNKNHRGNAYSTKTIVLKASCLMGGVDIK